MFGQPVIKELSNGIRYFWLPTEKFKTVTVKMYIHQELQAEVATKTALLPSVLERGTKRYPDSQRLRRELENLYGAELSTDVGKKGERHLLEVALEMIQPEYLKEKKLLQKGLHVMKSLLSEPLVEEGGFRRSYVDQEKDQLAREIKSLINDKTSYALERCVQEMCSGERFGIYKLGSLENLEKIEREELYNYSQQLLRENPIDLYIVGLQEQEEVESLLNDTFSFPRAPSLKEIPPTEVYMEDIREVTETEEKMPVNQGKLVMGYRTNIAYDHELYYPLAFYNGILGTFPHSKLFQNVREKASLAYFVFSRMERHKGIMVVAAGIDNKDYEQAVDIIKKQTEAISRGEITREEMENTRIGFMNQLRTQTDNPNSLINFYLDADIGGRRHSFEDVMDRLMKVTPEEVVEAAQKVKLDTVYFLRGENGGDNNHA